MKWIARILNPVIIGSLLLPNVSFAKDGSNPYVPVRELPPVPSLEESVPIGKIEGSLTITPDGAATYEVPLIVPQGRQGLEPALSVRYNSRGGDGLLGLRWFLEGLSSITRTGSTYAEDGIVRQVSFSDSLDRFSLDGERLVVLEGGYGDNNSEYRTKEDQIAKIICHKDSSDGIYGFTVYRKNGLIYHYGAKTTSDTFGQKAVLRVRDGVPSGWFLSEVEDRHGNYMTIEYEKTVNCFVEEWDGTPPLELSMDILKREDMDIYPVCMSYTGNHVTGKLPQRTVEFVYDNRMDNRFGFFAGIRTLSSLLLREVQMYHNHPVTGKELIRSYLFEYSTAETAATSNCLIGIRETDGKGVSKPATTFDWESTSKVASYQNGEIFYDIDVEGQDVGYKEVSERKIELDINGDGYTDYAYIKEVTGSTGLKENHLFVKINGGKSLYESKGYYGFSETVDMGIVDIGIDLSVDHLIPWGIATDYNKDGRDDILLLEKYKYPYCPGTWKVLLNNGGSFTLYDTGVSVYPRSGWNTSFFMANLRTNTFLVDLNGDGLDDLVTREQVYDYYEYYYRLHTGDEFGSEQQVPFPKIISGKFLDYNGDGVTDLRLFLEGDDKYNVISFTEGSPTLLLKMDRPNLTIDPDCSWQWLNLDINGDGLVDELGLHITSAGRVTKANMWVNTGKGFIGGPQGLAAFPSSRDFPEALKDIRLFASDLNDFRQVMDINHDGRDDLIFYNDVEEKWKIFYASGDFLGFDSAGNNIAYGFDMPVNFLPASLDFCNGTRGILFDEVNDFNGDMVTDLIIYNYSAKNKYICPSNEKPAEVITKIRDGMIGISKTHPDYDDTWTYKIDYASTLDSAVYDYTPMASVGPLTFPLLKLHPMMNVVSSYEQDNGKDLTPFMRNFKYYHSVYDFYLGWLGFSKVEEVEIFSGKKTQTFYDDYTRKTLSSYAHGYYPFAGEVTKQQVDVSLDSGRYYRTVTINEYHDKQLHSGKTYFSYLNKKTVDIYDHSSPLDTYPTEPIQRVTSIYGNVDDFGTMCYESVQYSGSTIDGPIDTVIDTVDVKTVLNDQSNWLIGLKKEVDIQSYRFGETKNKKLKTTYYPASLLPFETVREPGDPELELTTQYVYDVYGNPTEVTIKKYDGVSRKVKTTYDTNEHIFPYNVENSLGHLTTSVYHPGLGVKQIEMDANGISTVSHHDGFGRLVAEEVDGTLISKNIDYQEVLVDGHTRLQITETDSTGKTKITEHDRLGRAKRVETTGWSGNVETTITYNDLGLKGRTSLPCKVGNISAGYVDYIYDKLGRIVSQKNNLGFGYEKEYERLKEKTTDANGNVRVSQKDFVGQTASTYYQHVSSSPMLYSYGAFGYLKQVKDPYGNITEIDVDSYGRIISYKDPNSGVTTKTYNGFDEIVLEEVNGKLIENGYDELGRVIQRKDSDGTYTWQYDINYLGKLYHTTNPWGNFETYTYTFLGQTEMIEKSIHGKSFYQSFEYDDFGRKTVEHLPEAGGDKFALQYVYDSKGYIRYIKDYYTSKEYYRLQEVDPSGQIRQYRYGDGTETIKDYDDVNYWLTSITNGKQDLRYTYDANGNLLQRYDAIEKIKEDIDYDEFNRVVFSQVSIKDKLGNWNQEAPITYEYDDIGNIVYTTYMGEYHYDDSSHPYAVTEVDTHSGYTYKYDLCGNQISRPSKTGTVTIDYTSFSKPKCIRKPGTLDTAFEYDSSFQRVFKKGGFGESYYVNSNYEVRWNPTLTYDTHYYYIYANGTKIGCVKKAKTSSCSYNTSISYFSHDNLGSILENSYYDVFGQARDKHWSGDEKKITSIYGYTAHEHDDISDLGLINMKGRMYDPKLGRFLSPDPVIQNPYDSQNYNRYSYCLNNPMKYTDPTGYYYSNNNPFSCFYEESKLFRNSETYVSPLYYSNNQSNYTNYIRKRYFNLQHLTHETVHVSAISSNIRRNGQTRENGQTMLALGPIPIIIGIGIGLAIGASWPNYIAYDFAPPQGAVIEIDVRQDNCALGNNCSDGGLEGGIVDAIIRADGEPISRLYFAIHGNGRAGRVSLARGRGRRYGREEAAGLFEGLRPFMAEDGIIFLASCTIGLNQPFVLSIANAVNRPVYAPRDILWYPLDNANLNQPVGDRFGPEGAAFVGPRLSGRGDWIRCDPGADMCVEVSDAELEGRMR